ncbi:NAD(P)H-binding protein [Actinomadura hibisca]|uniref:NAD(P)H-binding protein n=1 Tax=Actinomadura hibisca TaxID=68565 RepID=UPI00083603F4|nr:NAD(P)H-binding protein [Actinomadura hibisca]
MFVITGATGNVGRPLVEALLRDGHKVRALTRSPAIADLPAEAEVANIADLPFTGATALFLNPAVVWGGSDALLARAKADGVRRIVTLSSSSAFYPDNPLAGHHLGLERAVEATGLEWTHLRPGAFASNAQDWADQIRAGDVVRGPYARAHSTPIHERDIADVAAVALTGDDLVGARPLLTGPQSLTHADQARVIGEVLGREVRYEEKAPADVVAGMVERGAPAPIAEALLNLWAEAVDRPEQVSPEVERITGRPGLTFAEWAADHAGDFR